MIRRKRTAQVKAHVTPELREQLELFVAEEGSVVSMSDYLFAVLAEHVAAKRAKRVVLSEHGITRRVATS